MKYIAFFDVLGIKELAKFKANLYSNFIEHFTDKLVQTTSEVCSKIPENNFRIYFFSDSAFIESTDLGLLFQFFHQLRLLLLNNNPTIVFTAAITKGELKPFSISGSETEEDLDSNEALNDSLRTALKSSVKYLRGTIFTKDSISKVYLLQHSLKGIGIKISIDKSDDKVENELLNKNLCESYFFPNDSLDKFEMFFDLRFEKKLNTDATIDAIISKYHPLNKRNKKIAKYYFSLLASLINSSELTGLSIEDDKIKALPSIFNFLLFKNDHRISELCRNAWHFNLLYFLMLSKIYAYIDSHAQSKEIDENSELSRILIKKMISISSCKSLFDSLDEIPNEIFSYDDKNNFLNDYNLILST